MDFPTASIKSQQTLGFMKFEEWSADPLSLECSEVDNVVKKIGKMYLLNGYTYVENKVRGDKKYLRCLEFRKFKCKGTVRLSRFENRINTVHNHLPDYAFEIKIKIRATIREISCMLSDCSPLEIYKQVVQRYKETEQYFPFHEVRHLINRYIRQAKFAKRNTQLM